MNISFRANSVNHRVRLSSLLLFVRKNAVFYQRVKLNGELHGVVSGFPHSPMCGTAYAPAVGSSMDSAH